MRSKILIYLAVLIAFIVALPLGIEAEENIKLTAVGKIDTEGLNSAAIFTPDDKYLITGSSEGILSIWETESLKLINEINIDQGEIKKLDISKDGAHLSILSYYELSVWNLNTLEKVSSLEDYITDIEFSQNGDLIYFVKNDILQYWNYLSNKIEAQ